MSQPRALLEIVTPQGKRTVELSDRIVTIGRGVDCDVVVPEPFVSACHAQIVPSEEGYVLKDSGSTNGTWVDSTRVKGSKKLDNGVSLILGRPGNYRLQFILQGADSTKRAGGAPRSSDGLPLLSPGGEEAPDAAAKPVAHRAGGTTSTSTNLNINRNLHEVLEISRALLSTLDLEEVLARVLDACLRIAHAERGYLFLQEGSDLKLRARRDDRQDPESAEQVEFSHSIAVRVAATGQPEYLTDLDGGRVQDKSASIARLRLKAIACVPLKIQDRVIGIVYLDSHRPFARPDRMGREVVEVLAGLAAVAIENARMVQERVQNDRWTTVGKVAASIVHDIRSPMAALRGTAELLRAKLVEPTHKDKLNVIIHEVDRLSRLSGEMLEFSSGAQPLDLERLSLASVVKDFLTTVEPRLEQEHIRLDAKLEETAPLRLDRHKMARLLHNVVGNALEAMEPGGTLTVTVSGVKDRVVLAIEDTGCGMDAETASHVCEPFFSQGKKHGTGLGMAIVRRIAEQHGATLALRSDPGRGTRVEFSFPRSDAISPAA